MNKRNNFWIAAVLLLSAACGGGATPDRVTEMVKRINKKCPVLVDEETLLKQVTYDQQKTITYTYHLVHLEQQQVDTAAFRKALWPGLLANIKVDHELKDLREAGYSFLYEYRDKNGKPIQTLNIRPANYNN